MDFQLALGIDMSKLTFDYALIDHQGTILSQGQATNNQTAILKWIGQMEEEFDGVWSKAIVCMEHFGFYGAHFLQAPLPVRAVVSLPRRDRAQRRGHL